MLLNPQSEYVKKADLLKLLFHVTFECLLVNGMHSFSIMTTFYCLTPISYYIYSLDLHEVIVVITYEENAESQLNNS